MKKKWRQKEKRTEARWKRESWHSFTKLEFLSKKHGRLEAGKSTHSVGNCLSLQMDGSSQLLKQKPKRAMGGRE